MKVNFHLLNKGPVVIVCDGSSYYGLLKCDVKEAQEDDPDIEVIEEHPLWTDEVDYRIEDLNKELNG